MSDRAITIILVVLLAAGLAAIFRGCQTEDTRITCTEKAYAACVASDRDECADSARRACGYTGGVR